MGRNLTSKIFGIKCSGLLIRITSFYIVRSVHDRCSIITLLQLMHSFNISVLQYLQSCYNFAQHVSIVIRSSSGAYNFKPMKII
jgi:hypothetical protein